MRATTTATLCLAALATLQIGCASPGRPVPAAPAERGIAVTRELSGGERAALVAEQQVGVRYRFGGTTPSTGFDCSGLVHYSFGQVGIDVPRTSSAQFRAARKISLHEARPGDIVFFQDQEKLSHVGIYLGGQRFVHAPSSGRTVSVARIDTPYYQEHLVAVGRLSAL